MKLTRWVLLVVWCCSLELLLQAQETRPKTKTGEATSRKKKAPESTPKKRAAAREDADETPATTEKAATPRPKKKKAAGEDATPASEPTPADSTPAADDPPAAPPKVQHAPPATLEPSDLAEFSKQPAGIQQVITAALALTKLNLTYTYGSADPANGGMDCSGAIFYLLNAHGMKDVPRDSSSQYVWARKNGQFFAVVSTQADSFEFKDLQPGDLMFWSGTYNTGRAVPISHVMLYLGHEKGSGKSVMFGSSDGRSYNGVSRWGVSVFDFKMPKADPAKPERRVDFVGYARIPGLRESTNALALAVRKPEKVPALTQTAPSPVEPPAPAPAATSKSPPAPVVNDKLREPARGNPERKAIMDALRAEHFPEQSSSVIFQVQTLKVHNGWAWAEVTPQTSAGKPVAKPISALMQWDGAQWKSVDLSALPERAESSKDAGAWAKAVTDAYPTVPADILVKTRK